MEEEEEEAAVAEAAAAVPRLRISTAQVCLLRLLLDPRTPCLLLAPACTAMALCPWTSSTRTSTLTNRFCKAARLLSPVILVLQWLTCSRTLPSDSVNGLAPLPFTPSYEFEGFNTFEDPFSYSVRPAYDVPGTGADEPFNEESPSQDLDNKLLGFSAPLIKAQLVDGAGNFAETNMSAELYGMFFVAEDVFGGENTGRPLELTCYRRNLWQCSGQITLPRHLSHLIDEQGQQVPIIELAASITAMESIDGKPTEIISIPWKSSSAATPSHVHEDSKSPTAPPRISLDLSTGQELDHNRVSLPVSWKRLQFKHATANNGRRKGLQQHYLVQINLLSKTKTGDFAKIAEIQSGPVIVRGRSPRNFDSRKDVPLSGDKKTTERRSTTAPYVAETPGFLKTEKGMDLAQNIQKYHSLGNVQVQ